MEYKLAQWLEDHKPSGRVFASGSFRFRLNALFPIQQVSGTFESGLKNRIAVDYYYQVRTGEGSKPQEEVIDSRMELAAIGTEYAVIHDLGSALLVVVAVLPADAIHRPACGELSSLRHGSEVEERDRLRRHR